MRNLAAMGLSNEDIARVIGVGSKTLYRWLGNYAEFRQSLQDGREDADLAVVQALFRRAVGFETTETVIIPGTRNGRPSAVSVPKAYPPDVRAATFWLSNRQPERWGR